MKAETNFKNQLTKSECSIGIEQNISEKLILPDRGIREGLEPNKNSLSHQLLKWLSPKNKILIIEDQLPDKHRCNLDRSGVTPDFYVIAESLDEALQMLHQGNIGLIITDLDFPMKRDGEIVRLNGRRIIQAAQMARIPVLLSSSREPDDIALGDIDIPRVSKGDWDERDFSTICENLTDARPNN